MRASQALLPGATFEADRLLAPRQAIIAYLSQFSAHRSIERVALEDAFDRVLAQAVVAAENHPAERRSTMDGFAVASVATPGSLPIVGTVRMGQAPPPYDARGVMRIATGGVVPDGADAVVPIEDASAGETHVTFANRVKAGQFITDPGDDLRAGEIVFTPGRRVGGPELGVLATLGVIDVAVFARPLVGIISTGDELIEPGATPGPGQVRDSNRYAVAGSLRAMGARVRHFPRTSDAPETLRRALEGALAACDAVIITGGSSVGERDHTAQVVAELGSPGVIVHGLRVKPGKPTLLAAIGSKPVIGLPGNPVSSLMILEAVAAPVIHALTGEQGRAENSVDAVAAADFAGREGWTWYVPARLERDGERLMAFPLALRSSHTSLLARAAGYAVVGENEPLIVAGAALRVVRFSSGGREVPAQ